ERCHFASGGCQRSSTCRRHRWRGLISALGPTLDTRGRRDGEKRRPPLTATTLGSVGAVSQQWQIDRPTLSRVLFWLRIVFVIGVNQAPRLCSRSGQGEASLTLH